MDGAALLAADLVGQPVGDMFAAAITVTGAIATDLGDTHQAGRHRRPAGGQFPQTALQLCTKESRMARHAHGAPPGQHGRAISWVVYKCPRKWPEKAKSEEKEYVNGISDNRAALNPARQLC